VRRRGEISDPVHGADTCFMHGPKARGGQPHYDILARQPDTADNLPPQGLFLNDLADTVMSGAVSPKRLHPLITLCLDLSLAESESQA